MTGSLRRLQQLAPRLEPPLLIGRAGLGLVMATAPAVVGYPWLGTRSRSSCRFVRAIGIRDLVICAGQLRARPQTRVRWRQFAAASDVFDALVSLAWAVARRRPASGAVAVPALGSAGLTALTF